MDTQMGAGALVRWTAASTAAWSGASLAGFLALGALVDALLGDPDRVLDGPVGFGLALGAVLALAGAASGAVQARFLRTRGAQGTHRWVLGSAAGFGTVGLLYALLEPVVPLLVNEVVHNVAGGLLAGAVQAGVLAPGGRPAPRRAWAAAVCLAYLTGASVNAVVARLLDGDEALSGVAGAAGVAAVLGLAVRRLLPAPTPAPQRGVPAVA